MVARWRHCSKEVVHLSRKHCGSHVHIKNLNLLTKNAALR